MSSKFIAKYGKKPQIHHCVEDPNSKRYKYQPQKIIGNPKPHPKLKNLKLVPNKRK